MFPIVFSSKLVLHTVVCELSLKKKKKNVCERMKIYIEKYIAFRLCGRLNLYFYI